MSRHISSVLDIKLGTKKSWTVLVQVVDGKPRNEFRRLVLSDSEGTKLNRLIYKNHLRYFAYLFVPYKRYYISNAILSRNDPRYRLSVYEYSCILNNKTLVEEFVESIHLHYRANLNLQTSVTYTNMRTKSIS